MLFITWWAQAYTGHQQFNEELEEKGMAAISFSSYLISPHFMEATFENWGSEFLQMGMYVLLPCGYGRKGLRSPKTWIKKRKWTGSPNRGRMLPGLSIKADGG